MTCMNDRDEQCQRDCKGCPRCISIICRECGRPIDMGEKCYMQDDDYICSECAENVADDILTQMPFADKLELAGIIKILLEE